MFRWCMLELVEGFIDVPWHGDVYISLVIVPVNGEATVIVAWPVSEDGVVFTRRCKQLFTIFLSEVFYAKIIYS